MDDGWSSFFVTHVLKVRFRRTLTHLEVWWRKRWRKCHYTSKRWGMYGHGCCSYDCKQVELKMTLASCLDPAIHFHPYRLSPLQTFLICLFLWRLKQQEELHYKFSGESRKEAKKGGSWALVERDGTDGTGIEFEQGIKGRTAQNKPLVLIEGAEKSRHGRKLALCSHSCWHFSYWMLTTFQKGDFGNRTTRWGRSCNDKFEFKDRPTPPPLPPAWSNPSLTTWFLKHEKHENEPNPISIYLLWVMIGLGAFPFCHDLEMILNPNPGPFHHPLTSARSSHPSSPSSPLQPETASEVVLHSSWPGHLL